MSQGRHSSLLALGSHFQILQLPESSADQIFPSTSTVVLVSFHSKLFMHFSMDGLQVELGSQPVHFSVGGV